MYLLAHWWIVPGTDETQLELNGYYLCGNATGAGYINTYLVIFKRKSRKCIKFQANLLISLFQIFEDNAPKTIPASKVSALTRTTTIPPLTRLGGPFFPRFGNICIYATIKLFFIQAP